MKVRWLLILSVSAVCLADPFFNMFNAGEETRLAEKRIDLDRRMAGVSILENMLVKQQGGVIRRPGTEYMADVPVSVTFTTNVTRQDVFMPEGVTLGILTSIDGKRLDSGGNPENVGGYVGLPSTGHGFSENDVIRIGGTDNFTASTYNVRAETTVDQLVIDLAWNANYANETFDSSEVIVLLFPDYFSNVVWSAGCCQIDNYMYVPVTAVADDLRCIVRVNMDDYSLEEDWADAPSGGWVATQSGMVVRATSDENAVILRTVDPVSGNYERFYKYDLDGNLLWEWHYDGGGCSGGDGRAYDMDLDSSDRPYGAYYQACSPGGYKGMRLKADGSDVDQWYHYATSGIGAMVCVVDDENGYVYFGGSQLGSLPTPIWFSIKKYDITTSDTTVYTTIETSIPGTGNGQGFIALRKYGDYLYCTHNTITYDGEDANIFKLDLDLNVQYAQYLQYAISLYSDGNYLYVVRDSWNGLFEDTIYKYSLDDLSQIEAINARAVENDHFIINRNLFTVYEEYETTYTVDYDTTPLPEGYAYRLIPFEYSTDQAYILGFGDGCIGFYRNGAQIEGG